MGDASAPPDDCGPSFTTPATLCRATTNRWPLGAKACGEAGFAPAPALAVGDETSP